MVYRTRKEQLLFAEADSILRGVRQFLTFPDRVSFEVHQTIEPRLSGVLYYQLQHEFRELPGALSQHEILPKRRGKGTSERIKMRFVSGNQDHWAYFSLEGQRVTKIVLRDNPRETLPDRGLGSAVAGPMLGWVHGNRIDWIYPRRAPVFR